MKNLLLLAFGLFCMQLNAQTSYISKNKGEISGTVLDKETKAKLEYCTVSLYNQQDSSLVAGCLTDNAGSFKLEEIAVGNYFLKFSFLGYATINKSNIEISKEKPLQNLASILLEASVNELDEIAVTEKKQYITLKVDKKVINVSDNSNVQGQSAIEALRNTPSIKIEGDDLVKLRGSENFQVLIDGKPSAQDGQSLLKMTSASDIDKIEVITNPGANYSPEGSAGIVNIIMKKGKKNGINGLIDGCIGNFEKREINTSFNFKTKGANIYIGTLWQNGQFENDNEFDQHLYTTGDTIYHWSKDENINSRNRKGLKSGVDFYLNESNTISISGYAGIWENKGVNNNRERNSSFLSPEKLYYYNSSNSLRDGKYYSAALNYEHKFEKEGHRFALNYNTNIWNSDYSSVSNSDSTNSEYVLSDVRYTNTSATNNKNQVHQSKFDYYLPLTEKHKLEAGVDFTNRQALGQFYFLTTSPLFEMQPGINQINNSPKFQMNQYSAYLTFEGEVISCNYKLGIRTQYMDRVLTIKELGKDYKYDKFDFFPSIHISKNLSEKHQIFTSYSKRIWYPNEWQLNPLPNFVGQFAYGTGNPDLLPEYTDSYELGYQLTLSKGFFSFQLFNKYSKNDIQYLPTLTAYNKMNYRGFNIAEVQNSGAETMFNYALTEWFNFNANFSLSNNNIRSAANEFTPVAIEQNDFSYSINSSLTFNLKKGTTIQIDGYYSSPSNGILGKQSGWKSLRYGVKQGLFKKRLTIGLNASNLFKEEGWTRFEKTTHVYNDAYSITRGPIFSFTMSYKLNNYVPSKFSRDNGAPQ